MDSVIESCGITTNLLIGILSCIEHNVEALIYCIDNKKKISEIVYLNFAMGCSLTFQQDWSWQNFLLKLKNKEERVGTVFT